MGSKMVMERNERRAGFGLLVLSAVSTLFALIMLKFLSVYRIRKIVSTMKKRCHQTMTMEKAVSISESLARSETLYFFARIACLERSLAFVLCSIFIRQKVEWCIGVQTTVFESHAWVEVNGEPVCEPENVRNYNKMIVV